MGNICGSSNALTEEEMAEIAKNAEINGSLQRQIISEQQEAKQYVKLLLLGAGESGKSTIFKQMVTIYGRGYSDQVDLEPTTEYLLDENPEDCEIDEELSLHIKALWNDPEIGDSASYFLDKVEEIGSENYFPTPEDILRARVRTTGIVEREFEIGGKKFKFYDVGGQRSERKKWIHCFEDCTAVIFVAALSEYDLTLYEDSKTNRSIFLSHLLVQEALTLFREICNSRWFAKTAIILFLNKSDIFKDKIQNVPLKRYFIDYDGPNTYEAASEYIKEVFVSQNTTVDKKIFTHITCAMNTDNIRFVMDSVKEIVLNRALDEADLNN